MPTDVVTTDLIPTDVVTTTMGDLIDVFIKHWVVNSQGEAQIWSSENFSLRDEIRHQVTYLIPPK